MTRGAEASLIYCTLMALYFLLAFFPASIILLPFSRRRHSLDKVALFTPASWPYNSAFLVITSSMGGLRRLVDTR